MAQVLKAMFAKVEQCHPFGQILLDQIMSPLGQDYLATVCGGGDACGTMDVDAHVKFGSADLRLPCVQTHTDTHLDTLCPLMSSQRALSLDGRMESIPGAGKRNKESIALIADHASMVRLADLLHQLPVVSEQGREIFAQLLQEPRGAFNIGK